MLEERQSFRFGPNVMMARLSSLGLILFSFNGFTFHGPWLALGFFLVGAALFVAYRAFTAALIVEEDRVILRHVLDSRVLRREDIVSVQLPEEPQAGVRLQLKDQVVSSWTCSSWLTLPVWRRLGYTPPEEFITWSTSPTAK